MLWRGHLIGESFVMSATPQQPEPSLVPGPAPAPAPDTDRGGKETLVCGDTQRHTQDSIPLHA